MVSSKTPKSNATLFSPTAMLPLPDGRPSVAVLAAPSPSVSKSPASASAVAAAESVETAYATPMGCEWSMTPAACISFRVTVTVTVPPSATLSVTVSAAARALRGRVVTVATVAWLPRALNPPGGTMPTLSRQYEVPGALAAVKVNMSASAAPRCR